MDFDYEYLCKGLGMLTGLQTRVYKGLEQIFSYSYLEFMPDIVSLVLDRIIESKDNAGYFDTPDFLVFGAVKVKTDDITIIIGPTSQIKQTAEQTADLLRTLGEPHKRLRELYAYFQNTPSFSLESFIQIVCFLDYALNDEKISVSDLILRELTHIPLMEEIKKGVQTDITDEVRIHNTYEMERMMMSYITSGKTDALKEMFTAPPVGRVGKIAHDTLRQRKNTFVCAATLASRAAIAGGLSTETAFSLSDLYIQKAELMNDYHELTRLNMDMLIDYAHRVEQTKYRDSGTKLIVAVSRYVNQNINRKITVQEMADSLKMNRSYLCEQFKSDLGLTLTEFITEQKITEAKIQLELTEQSIVQISEYLGFSSQSYFQNVFKKAVGCTPKEYRDSYGRAQSTRMGSQRND